ncbi:MAG: transglycosylase SLT domain-containing protein [Ignavibacteriales bacterium]|nr:transglycosylase SLT domain-containing protein [Ignavibacteriales bacterium]
MDNSTLKEEGFLKAITMTLVLGVFLTGCVNPNPGLNFVSKETHETGLVSAREAVLTQEEMDLRTSQSIEKYGPVIQKYAYQYQVDWRLVLAVMKQESSFRPKAVSRKGAYGLMQIMPVTEAELSHRIGVRNAKTPYNNIKAGIFHLKSLYRYFDEAKGHERTKLTLAAYNAGLNRIRDAQDIARFMGGNPHVWNDVKDALPMLSRHYKTLHARVWETSVPRSGYFADVRQTTRYVDSIMSYYDEFQVALR